MDDPREQAMNDAEFLQMAERLTCLAEQAAPDQPSMLLLAALMKSLEREFGDQALDVTTRWLRRIEYRRDNPIVLQ